MITGFNTDVEYDGVVYHVQTEDKGLESPLILSLVYAGGAILASKRSRYEDLIASGFSEEVLAERLKRQHRLICAAIHAGRLDDLKRMGVGQAEVIQTEPVEVETAAAAETEAPAVEEQAEAAPPAASLEETLSSISRATANDVEAFTIHDQRRQSPLGEIPLTAEGLRISILDDRDFRSGDSLNLRIMVSHISGKDETPVSGAEVSLKVLGTTFRPQIYSIKTQRDGIASVTAQIPQFTSGRAAILIRALADGSEAEMRRVIHPS
ncbi:MAG: hypothetical protein ACRD8U_10220 [Pyrinomonadaceae bacterium]